MSILLTGANGQVGWEVQRLAKEQGLPLVALGRDELDISDREAVAQRLAASSASIVINGAAYTAVDKAEQEPELAFAINGDGPGFLAEACAKLGIPLLHISTDYVFDGASSIPYREGDAVNPLNVYGRSKLAGEDAVRRALARHVILRTSWVFGSHGNNFVKTVLRLARGGGPLRIVDNQKGAPTSARGIAAALLAVAERYRAGGELPWGTYHFSGRPCASWYDFAGAIAGESVDLGMISPVHVHPITSADFSTPAKRPANTCLDGRRGEEMLGLVADDWRRELQRVLCEIRDS
ncbi:dTDP-4-dehydrorhamnose reductase [Gilvimarinus sp. F26214L]|uniref:dTDP-4-dehydrorhamnose reductase n=1 Tax=Gilvimarinus sp. DZF01 TaxID=3461371 RepID=UPI00404588D3